MYFRIFNNLKNKEMGKQKSKANRIIKKKNSPKRAIGSVPGSIDYMGEQISKEVIINVLIYDSESIQELSFEFVSEALNFISKSEQVCWLNIDGIHKTPIIKEIVAFLKLHKLSGQDILNFNQPSKLDEYSNHIHIISKLLQIENDKIVEDQVSIIFSERVLLSFFDSDNTIFQNISQRIKEAKGQVRHRKTDYLAYAILDNIVDHYFLILDNLSYSIDLLEDEILENPDEVILSKLNTFRKEVNYIRRTVIPMREVINQLYKIESELISEDNKPFIRDLSGNINQNIEMSNALKENISSLVQLYMNNVSYRMNNIIKVLTIVSTIFIPLTFIVGVYGMNFINMPELEYKNGYLFTIIGMAIITLLMILYFKRKKWI